MKHFVGILFLFAMLVTLQCQTKRGANAPTHPNMQPSGANAGDLSTPDGQAQAIMTASQIAAESSECMNEYGSSKEGDYTPTQAVCQVASQLATNTDLATSVVAQATETSSDGTANIDAMKQVVQASATRTSTQTMTSAQKDGLVILAVGAVVFTIGTVGNFLARPMQKPDLVHSKDYNTIYKFIDASGMKATLDRGVFKKPIKYSKVQVLGNVMEWDSKYIKEFLESLKTAMDTAGPTEFTINVNREYEYKFSCPMCPEKKDSKEWEELQAVLEKLKNPRELAKLKTEYDRENNRYERAAYEYDQETSPDSRAKRVAKMKTKRVARATALIGGLVALTGGAYAAFGLADDTQTPTAITKYIESLGAIAQAMKQ